MTEVTSPPSVPDPTTGPDRVSAPADYDAQTTTFRAAQRAYALSLPALAEWQRAIAVLVEGWAGDAETSAEAAETAAQTIIAASNYQGVYDADTLYAIGESVKYTGNFYIKNTTAAAGTTPVDGVDWAILDNFVKPDYTGDVDITGKLSATTFSDSIVTLTGTSPNVDLDAGGEFEWSGSTSPTFTFSNPPANGKTTTKTLRLTATGAITVTFPTIETVNGLGVSDPESGETREYILRARTNSGGITTYIMTEVGILS